MKKMQLPKWYGLYAFLLPFLILCAAFAALQITPFGDQMLIFGDSNGYYINYLSYFRKILTGEHGLYYTFSKGLGGNMADFAWGYLLSPYTWLFCLAGWDHLPEVFSWSVILMTSLSGLTMGLLLADVLGNRTSNLLFSTCYALCGFAVVNNYNIVFDTGLMMLPLVILGLRKLWQGKSPALYILSLAYIIAAGIQSGFVICTASLLCTLAWLYVRWNDLADRRRIVIRYAASSLTGGMLAAVVWLPELLALSGGRTGQTNIEDFVFTDNAPLLEMGARFFSGASSASQLVNGLPAVFCGILVPALVVLFFMNRDISKRKKRAAGALLGCYLLSFYIRTFTTVFQGFVGANWFNYRHSFVFSFLLILLAAEQFTYTDRMPLRQVRYAGMGILLLAILIFFKQYEFVSGGMVVMDLCLLSVMGWGMWFYRTKPERADRKSMVLLLLVCTCLQLYANYYFSMKHVFRDWGDEKKTVADFQESIDKKEPLVEGVMNGDPDFFRMEDEYSRSGMTGNDPLMFDYRGVGQGNTGERLFVEQNVSRLGVSFSGGGWNWYDKGMTASMDSLLGLRYILSKRNLAEEKGYEHKLTGMDGTAIYQNPYALPIAILSDDGIADISIEENKNVFDVQNQLWSAMTGEREKLFYEQKNISYSIHNTTDDISLTTEQIDELPDPQQTNEDEANGRGGNNGSSVAEDSSADSGQGDAYFNQSEDEEEDRTYTSYIEYTFTAKRDGPVYLYDSAPIVKDFGTSDDVLQYVGNFKKGETVAGQLYLDYTITKEILVTTAKGLHICYADMDRLAACSGLLQKREVTVRQDSDDQISGEVNAKEGQRLLFTIPYDEGWTLLVDGQEIPMEKTADLFLSANVPVGEHRYVMTFRPKGLHTGMAISLVALAGLMLQLVIHRKNHRAAGLAEADEPEDPEVSEDRQGMNNDQL